MVADPNDPVWGECHRLHHRDCEPPEIEIVFEPDPDLEWAINPWADSAEDQP